VYDDTPAQYPLSEYAESDSYINPQVDIPPFYIQASGSHENSQISKYQEENNRPIKKRSYKIIEGLLENEVWRAKLDQNKSWSIPTQLQSDTASTSHQLQSDAASTPTQLQNSTVVMPHQLQNGTVPTPPQLQNGTVPLPPQLQNGTVPTQTELQNGTAGCVSQDKVQIYNEDGAKEENESSSQTVVDNSNPRGEKHDENNNITTTDAQLSGDVHSDKANMSACEDGSGNAIKTDVSAELHLVSKSKVDKADSVNSVEPNESETTDIYNKEVKGRENSLTVVETEHKDNNKSNLLGDVDVRPSEVLGLNDKGEPSTNCSEVEVVIDNAEDPSMTSCETKYPSHDSSEAASVNGNPEEVEEEPVTGDGSESAAEQGESLKSTNVEISDTQLKSSNTLKYPGGYQSLESGDAPASGKILETENRSTRSGSKRRHPYHSPVRMPKRHKQ
jgi:hypothetical protein